MFSTVPVFPPKNFVPFTFTPHIEYGEANGVPLLLDMLCPSPLPTHLLPAVIYIFGGGWEGGHRSAGMYPWLSPLLTTQGFLTVNISYRMSYQAVFPAQMYDAKAAVRWLRANTERYHINPDRIGVWGFSSGGHLASLLGVTGDLPTLEGECGSPGYSSRVQAVVAAAAPSNFLHPGGQLLNDGPSNEVIRLFGGTVHEREEQIRLGSPISYVNADAPPFFLIHGTRDEVVPFEQTKQMYEALNAVGVEATLLPTDGVTIGVRDGTRSRSTILLSSSDIYVHEHVYSVNHIMTRLKLIVMRFPSGHEQGRYKLPFCREVWPTMSFSFTLSYYG